MNMNRFRYFPIRSWVDLHHVCKHWNLITFRFRDYPNYFCLRLTSPNFPFRLFPPSGYISPESMVTGLSASTRLERLFLELEFLSPGPDRESRRLPLPTRSVLPALTHFKFKGVSVYLDDLVARIDVPRLND